MKIFNFSFFIGLISLFVINGYANALPVKAFISHYTQTTNTAIIQSNHHSANELIDMEVNEGLDDNEDDSFKPKKEIKTHYDVSTVSTTIHFLVYRIRYNNSKIPHPSLFYKSWQSFFQVFRL